MNTYKNEKVIKMGDVEILLRPTFQNCVSLEAVIEGGFSGLTMRLFKSQMPGLTDITKVVYHCQAEKKYTEEEIWQLVMKEGMGISNQVLMFVAQITAGDKTVIEKKNVETTSLPS